jgi:hypothetical protein
LRDLPDTIARLEDRVAGLSADQATAAAHRRDPLTIGGRTYGGDDALAALGHRLDTLPEKVRDTARIAGGRYRGLAFGLALYAGGGAEVVLEGAATRHGQLSRDHRGPRAVLNALERLADSYPGQAATAAKDLAIARGQLRDHEARIGRPFAHDAYLAGLTELRDQLKAGLSQATPEPGTPPVAELAERIKSLKAAHTIDAAPERTATRRLSAEEPVTARIRRHREAAPDGLPPSAPEPVAPPAPMPPSESVTPASVHPFPEPAATIRPQPEFRQRVARARQQDGRQLSLF